VKATGNITVSATPACSVSTASTTPTLTVSTALTPNITHTTTSATGIGSLTGSGLPSGVTAAWSSNVITISGTPTATGTFNYTIPLTGTSCSGVNATGTITVNAACSVGTASSTPTLTVNTVLTPNITHTTTSATGIGSLTGSGLPSGVTANWSSNVITISGTPTAAGIFTYTIPLTGTSCSGVNATGTITVNAPSFTCGTSTVPDIDGNSYPTVSIGTQCWMAENLRVRKYNNGTDIRFDKSGTSTGSVSQTWAGTGLNYGAYTIYAHDSTTTTPSNLTKYGYLYNWYAVKGIFTTGVIASTDTLKICPSGWHVPTDAEWTTLETYLDNEAPTGSVGSKMKKNDALWTTNTGTDTSGFSALPGGRRRDGGSFIGVRNSAFFWSATENLNTSAWNRNLNFSNGSVIRSTISKLVGASVRCLRD
jgi:uncharacterized protein (TIGR02145 family)